MLEIERCAPDVVLIGVRIPGMDGIEATHRIVRGSGASSGKIIVSTRFDLDNRVYDALQATPPASCSSTSLQSSRSTVSAQ